MEQIRREDQSLSELFSELSTEMTTLFRQEIELAKIELRKKAVEAGGDVAFIGIGGSMLYAGVLAVIAGVVLLLGLVIPVWLSALIIGLGIGTSGYVLSLSRVKALKRLDPTPRATLATLRNDKEWVKEQLS